MKEYIGIVSDPENDHPEEDRTFSVVSTDPENAIYAIMDLYNKNFSCEYVELECNIELGKEVYTYFQDKKRRGIKMNPKLKELQSQIAQMELGYRNCSAKLLYVKDEIEEKDKLIIDLKSLVRQFAGYMESEGILAPSDIEEMEKVGIKYQSS